jgi:lipopolysaccharide export system protein LptA
MSLQYKFFFILLLPAMFLQLQSSVYGQKKIIRLIEADKMRGGQAFGEEVNIFTGNVVFEHDSVLLYCDSAVLVGKRNQLNAFRNVNINVNDSLNIFGEKLDYDGNTRIANIRENVKLVDNDATLTTDHLIYNRLTDIAYYTTGGQIVSDTNVLTSREGYYHTNTKIAHFKKDVVLINPSYRLDSDTLVYNTFLDIAFISGPTTIVGESEFLYAEDGWYETQTGKTKLMINPYIIYNEQFLSGDTIYYDKDKDEGIVLGNVFLKDSVQKIIAQGNYARYLRSDGYAFITQKPWATFIDESDSLFLHADTLFMTFDSIGNADYLNAYYKCRFFRTDLQGMCDSLSYSIADSTITMYHRPVIWTDENQISADLIKLFSSEQAVDSMYLINSSFIISADEVDPKNYNQIKGKNMTVYFVENELNRIMVEGNSETIYFVREENGDLVGINRAFSSNMKIFVEDRQVTDIHYFEKPDATLFPENEIPSNEMKLRGFIWLDEVRPRKKDDIFQKNVDEPVWR